MSVRLSIDGDVRITMKVHLRSLAAIAVIVSLLSACSGKEEQAYVEEPVEKLYNSALNKLESGNFEAAAEAFDEVDRQHPYSVWATKSQLMSAYAYYQANSYADALITLDRFIQLHPSNRDAPYAYYLKALSYYEQISHEGLDGKYNTLALKNLQQVINRFPNSKYAKDSSQKIILVKSNIAAKHMTIARFYHKKKKYTAALNRYKIVVDDFSETKFTPEALYRISEIYFSIGMIDESSKTAAILAYNYPKSKWYEYSYNNLFKKEKDSIFSKTLGRIFN